MNNVKATNLLVKDTNNKVRVLVEGETNIINTKVESGAKLEVAQEATATFGEIELAPKSKENVELVKITTNIKITSPVVVISGEPVITKINDGVEVTIKDKSNENLEGVTVVGTGGEAAQVDPTEVNRVMNALKDGMLDDKPYPGDKGTPGNKTYTLSSFVAQEVNELTTDNNIELEVTNVNVDYGYYKVTLTIAGATATKTIKVDTLTVETAKAFEDAFGYNINKIKIKNDITIDKSIIIPIEGTRENGIVVDGQSKTITLSENGTFTNGGIVVMADNIEIQNLTVDAKNQNAFGIQFDDVYDGKLNNVTLSNAGKGGLFVNGSIVTVKGITTSNNTCGGIKVSKGEAENLVDPKLTVEGKHNHTSPETGVTPAIWIDGKNTNDYWVIATGYKEMKSPNTEKPQYLFLDEEEYKKLSMQVLEKAVETALNYQYDPNYAYVGTPVFENNIVTTTYANLEDTGEGYKNIMNDMARYLGALYRQDDSPITEIIYNGQKYTWNNGLTQDDGSTPIKGSNWILDTQNTSENLSTKDVTSLVSSIVKDFEAATAENPLNGITITISDGTNKVNVTLTFKI